MKCELLAEDNLTLMLDFVDDENTKYEYGLLDINGNVLLTSLQSIELNGSGILAIAVNNVRDWILYKINCQ